MCSDYFKIGLKIVKFSMLIEIISNIYIYFQTTLLSYSEKHRPNLECCILIS